MNLFLWLGVISTAVLIAGLVFDVFDGLLDSLDAFEGIGGEVFSLPVLAAFVGAFGFGTGAFIDRLGTPAVFIGIAAGVIFGWGAVRLSRVLHHQPTDVTEREADLLAALGRVVVAPAPGRLGEVLLERPQGPLKVAASSEIAIDAGTAVVVVDVRSSTLVVVEPFDEGLT